ncbi:MAG TPA: pyridoxamine 5'-phosphate oxidase family protein [Candidatus Saccharimonadia bacterium]|jgi:uncharacterized protein YhbP (UPF0306 family)
METEAIIRQYIPQVIHMSLATCAGDRPWVCEVHFAFDEDLNLYFRSTPDRRHSREIAQNPNVAGNIVTQHHLNQRPRGIYFEGQAQQLTGVSTDSPAYKVISTRLGLGPKIVDDANAESGHQFYQIKVSDWYVFDALGPGPSAKHHLSWGNVT